MSERRRLATAHTTNARLRTGTEYTVNINPIIDVEMEMSMNWAVAKRANIIRTTAVQRSNRGALLKKAHQIITANPLSIPPNNPTAIASGKMIGKTYLRSN
jgi:hypothetical protein